MDDGVCSDQSNLFVAVSVSSQLFLVIHTTLETVKQSGTVCQTDTAPGDRLQSEKLMYKQHVAKVVSHMIDFFSLGIQLPLLQATQAGYKLPFH